MAKLAGFVAWCACTGGPVLLSWVWPDRRGSGRLIPESDEVMATPLADEVEKWLGDRG
jgi:hypothetical protein